MQPFPHRYHANATGSAAGGVRVLTEGVEALQSHAPPEFGGAAGYWSPETLLVAAVADCFILSFRSVARAQKLDWESLSVDVEGTLDREASTTRFTRFRIQPKLRLTGHDSEAGLAALQTAKRLCLVTNSLTASCELVPVVEAGAITIA